MCGVFIIINRIRTHSDDDRLGAFDMSARVRGAFRPKKRELHVVHQATFFTVVKLSKRSMHRCCWRYPHRMETRTQPDGAQLFQILGS